MDAHYHGIMNDLDKNGVSDADMDQEIITALDNYKLI